MVIWNQNISRKAICLALLDCLALPIFHKHFPLSMKQDMPCLMEETKEQLIVGLIFQAQLNQSLVLCNPPCNTTYAGPHNLLYEYYSNTGRLHM